MSERLLTAREFAERVFAAELMRRHRDDESVGWEPDPGEPEFGGDITKDRRRACGKLRGEGRVVARWHETGEDEERFDDPCIRDLLGVFGACCGHGRSGRAVYVQLLNGPAAARKMRELGGDPPPAAFLLDPIGAELPWRPS